ncbi:MAG: S8 family serine peptidase [Thermoanaerobaculia bacterium]
MTLVVAASVPLSAAPWIWDRDVNGIDDRIERVETSGIAAAFEGGDPSGRLILAVEDLGGVLRYGVYVEFEHHPTGADLDAIRATGVDTSVLHDYDSIPYVRMRLTFPEIQKVAALPGVKKIEAVELVYPVNNNATKTSGVVESDGRHFPTVHGNYAITGKGVVISILDTGVNDSPEPTTGFPGHESVAGRFVAGGNFYSGEPALNTPPDQSENPHDFGQQVSSNHGTHVAGTSLGTGGPTHVFGGVAPDALLVDQKVLSDAGAGFGSADGVDWAIRNKDEFNIKVLNLSLGTLTESDGQDAGSQAINAAFDAGLFPAVASGNDDMTDYMPSPAAADKAFTIGAITDQNSIERADDLIAGFSNEGPRDSDGDADFVDEMKPLVAAPGAGIVSADGSLITDGRQYKPLSGTSMATPHVAGIVALLLEANPALTPTDVREILKHTSEHRNDWGKTASTDNPFPQGDPNYHPSGGWGQVDAYAAVKEALRLAGDPGSQTQVVYINAKPAEDGSAAIDLTWKTQREIALSGFDVHRADDVSGAPGVWTKLTASSIPGVGSATIEGANNRNVYTFRDTTGLVEGQRYWYRIDHTSTDSTIGTIQEPPLAVTFGRAIPVARLSYSITHNTFDNDLLVLLGTGPQAERPRFIIDGKSALQADQVIVDPGEATTGNRRHLFTIDLTTRDGIEGFLPPSKTNPWFLSVKEGGFLNRTGRVNAFSMTLFDENGNETATYTTGDPTPQQLVEGTTTVLWIPDSPDVAFPGDTPTVLEADPSGGTRGETIEVGIFGAEFLPGATVSFGEGISVGSVDVVRGSQIDATITIAPDAAAGPRDVTVTNIDGGSGTATAAFTVADSGEAVVTDVDDGDPAVEYRRGWHAKDAAEASGGGYHRRVGSGNETHARLVFDGNQVTYHYATSNMGGSADVYLDGVLAQTISFAGDTKEPQFGHSVTFSGLADGQHELRIVHRAGASYVDGFQIVDGAADDSAPATRSVTSVRSVGIAGSTVLVETIELGAFDDSVSVVVEGAAEPLAVTMLNALGIPVATGSTLLEETTITGLDTVLAPGTYTLQVIGSATLAPSDVTVSVARTVRVK